MKKLVCIGGGEIPRIKNGIRLPYETKEIDEEIVRLSNKSNPKLLFISIASSNREEYFNVIKKVYKDLGCIVSHFDVDSSYEEMKEAIFNTDIIYVGGGNTRYLMEVLRGKKIDELLIEAYNRGIVCSGLSAGSYCWFNHNYDLIYGMNVVNAINCVHYNLKDEEAKNKLHEVIKESNLVGYAVDNCVALEFLDDKINVIKSDNNRNAYKITYVKGKFIEEKM